MNILTKGCISTVVAAALTIGVSATGTMAENIVYGTYSGPANTLNKKGIGPFLERVQDQSGGEIKTDFIMGGSLVTAKTGLFGMRDGLVDGIMLASLYYPTELPEAGLYINMGAVLKDTRAAAAALTEMMMLETCPDCTAEMDEWNIHTLGSWSTPAYDLLCIEPLDTLDKLNGKRIRGSGHTVPLIQALGAVAANATVTEIYEAMQRGQVDCTFGSASWLETYSIGDSAKYVIDVKAGGIATQSMLNIREDLWQTFSKEHRQLLLDNAAEAVAGATLGYLDDETSALATEGRGYQVMVPESDVLNALAKEAEAGVAQAVEIATGRGVANAQAKADAFLASYARWEGLLADVHDKDAFVKLLNAEVYSKVSVDD